MFSPELMRYLLQYQTTEEKPTKKYISFSGGRFWHAKKTAPVYIRSDK